MFDSQPALLSVLTDRLPTILTTRKWRRLLVAASRGQVCNPLWDNQECGGQEWNVTRGLQVTHWEEQRAAVLDGQTDRQRGKRQLNSYAPVYISAQMHTDTDIHIKTHTEAIKQPTSLVPLALCRGRAAQLFPHHSASPRAVTAPYPQLRPCECLSSSSHYIAMLSSQKHK